nr:hypothetical protein [Tanacetum cinerariifolium]
MDSIISLGQKNTLAEYMILFGADNHPPTLDKNLYDSWKSRMELYMQNKEHGRMILKSVEHGPLIWPTVEENDVIRIKKYAKLFAAEKIQADYDMKATNIILQGKATVDNVTQIPLAIIVAPGMFKLDLEPLAPQLVHNRESHSYYLKHTQEQADILRGVKCSTSASGSKPSGNTKYNRISQQSSSNKIIKVEDQPRSIKTRKNSKNRVKKVKCADHVMQSISNVNFISVFINNAPVKNSVNDVKFGCLCAICGCPDCTLVSGL